jgi:purine nucleoside permease
VDLPYGGEIPQDVAAVYTAQTEDQFELYDVIQLASEDGSLDIPLIVLGAVASNLDLLYVMDPRTGEILQFDLEAYDIQGVNSTFCTFVEFLYRTARFVTDDTGKQGRAARAAILAQESSRSTRTP